MKINKNSTLKQEIGNDILLAIFYLVTSILFAMPSILYLIKNKTIYNFVYIYTYTFKAIKTVYDKYANAIIYLILFFLLFFLYFMLLKKVNKIFKSNKKMFLFIAIIGLLFSIIIPTTSLDVYSYIGNGWVESNYNENPYYTSVQDITNEYGKDEMLGKVARCWRDEPVVYGPVWQFICKILTSISFGNITCALYIFKLASFIIFLSSSILIYKITKKKFFTILFALNPLILFEGLSNVHNDLYLVFFILLAIYFLKNKKNNFLSIVCIAIATGMKYLSILLFPFIICYILKNEKLKTKIIKAILYTIEFITIILLFYLMYVRNFQVLSGIFVQQNKYNRSIFLALWYILNKDEAVLNIVKVIALSIFAISYIAIIIKMFFGKNAKKITFKSAIRVYQVFLMIFTFILITNFNSWYIIWLFPTLMWQKAKTIRTTMYLSLGALIPYAITYATLKDDETVGVQYFIVMIFTAVGLLIARKLYKKLTKEK